MVSVTTYFIKSLGGDQLQLNRLHGSNVTKTHLRYVEGANHVGPAIVVGTLQRPVLTRTQFTLLRIQK